jgi:hypothetical protein
MIVKGTVLYVELSGGFWGVEDSNGQQWRPEKMPKALQKKGMFVELDCLVSKKTMSIFMWGTTIQITDYKIIA